MTDMIRGYASQVNWRITRCTAIACTKAATSLIRFARRIRPELFVN
jgi:hypothetical protein